MVSASGGMCNAGKEPSSPAPNGAWVMFKDVEAQAARIAEMEVAIYQYVNHVVSYEGTSFIDEMNDPPWAKLINDTWVKQAMLGEEK